MTKQIPKPVIPANNDLVDVLINTSRRLNYQTNR